MVKKSEYGPTLTINTSIRPIFWYRTEDYYLLTGKRIGEFDKGFDKWYPIERDYFKLVDSLTVLINEKVIPHFDRCNSPKKVIQNIAVLEGDKKTIYDNLILFSALRENNYELSLKYLTKKIDSVSKDTRNLDWVNNDKRFYSEMYELIKQNNFPEINSRLDAFKEEFIKNRRSGKVPE